MADKATPLRKLEKARRLNKTVNPTDLPHVDTAAWRRQNFAYENGTGLLYPCIIMPEDLDAALGRVGLDAFMSGRGGQFAVARGALMSRRRAVDFTSSVPEFRHTAGGYSDLALPLQGFIIEFLKHNTMLFDVIVDRGGPCPPQKPWSYFNIKSCQWGNHGGSSHAGCCSLHGSPGPYDFRGARDVITYSALTCRYCPFIPRLDFVREYADAGRRLAAESMTPGGRYGRVCAWLQGSAPAVRGVVWF